MRRVAPKMHTTAVTVYIEKSSTLTKTAEGARTLPQKGIGEMLRSGALVTTDPKLARSYNGARCVARLGDDENLSPDETPSRSKTLFFVTPTRAMREMETVSESRFTNGY